MKKTNKLIYVDNAATTQISQTVLSDMLPYFDSYYANPSSNHRLGREVKQILENSRSSVCSLIGGYSEDQIIFTSSGTEANNLALVGYMLKNKKKNIIVSSIEHLSILETCKYLEKIGFSVTYLPVNVDGLVSLQELKSAITEDTALISIMFVNNEIGTIQPIEDISQLCKEKGIIFHTDAVQAVGQILIDVRTMGIDMLSLSGHKLNGPKGIGMLYLKNKIQLQPLIYGGGQENNLRSGTENIANIVGLTSAIKETTTNLEGKILYLKGLQNHLIEGILKIPNSYLTGHRTLRVANSASFVFTGIMGEGLVTILDMQGVYCSTGSACSSGGLKVSHVINAINTPKNLINSSIRISLSISNTIEEVNYIIEKITNAVNKMRKLT